MVPKEYANLEAERQYREYAATIIQEVEKISEIFENETWEQYKNQSTFVIESLMMRVERIFKAQMYRVLYELLSDNSRFEEMREPEWWNGEMRDKWHKLSKNLTFD